MHVPTHNFADVDANLTEIQKRVVDALFHVRDTEGAAAVLVSVFLPDAQCHVLAELDDEDPHRCHLSVVTDTPERASVTTRVTAEDYEQTVTYVRHIVSALDERRSVSNLMVTTDGRRIQDVTGQIHQSASGSDDASSG